ncbi:MAG: tail fiber protein [Bacteroidota bacterium]
MEGFIGEIRIFAGTFAPRTWAFCEGQLIAISQNEALFSILGTIYGGDGRTTFALPDLRGRAALHKGSGPGLPTYRLGQRGGSPTNVITTSNLPTHNHTGTVKGTLAMGAGSAGTGTGAGNSLASTSTAGDIFIDADPNAAVKLKGTPVEPTVTLGLTGSQQAINNMQPYIPIYYIICMFGIFPSRH